MNGYIKIQRQFFDHVFWNEPRQFSRSEAWLDLLQLARLDDGSVIHGNQVLEVKRGDVVVSRRFLEKRWSWGGSKVMKFLELLERDKIINQQVNHKQTIITICDYDSYRGSKTKTKPPSNHPQTTNEPQINHPEDMLTYCNSGNYEDEKFINKPQTNHKQTTNEPLAKKENKKEKESNKEKERDKERNIYIPPIIPPNGEIVPQLGDDGDISFDAFWDAYDKKVGRKDKIARKWEKLKKADRLKIMSYIEEYKQANPDKKYRKNPETFLNNESWNDEIITPAKKEIKKHPFAKLTGHEHYEKF